MNKKVRQFVVNSSFTVVPGIAAVGIINQAVDEGDPHATLNALKMKTAQLQNVDNKQALHYQNLLATKKQQRAEV